MSAGRVLTLVGSRAELGASPEFRYLRSWTLDSVRALFARVIVLEMPGRSARLPERWNSHALFLADENVLLGRASLQSMLAAIAAGADVAVPVPLASALGEVSKPVYTLRGFEEAERRILERGLTAREEEGHLPVSLWRFEALQQAFPGLVVERLMDGSRPLTSFAPDLRVATAGVFHRFNDYYSEVRSDILPHVPSGVRDVLEIGCGRGATGKLLKDRLGCRVTGVELNPLVAEDARRRLDAVVSGDVMTANIPGKYDLIVACELFEHLTDQEGFLQRMRGVLAPGGTILLSVPNVGHWSVVADLLAGRWDYLPIGLLCYTHYRFFTRPTLESWVRRGGFRHVELVAQRTELPAEFPALAAGSGFEVDLESLSTKGFYVLIRA